MRVNPAIDIVDETTVLNCEMALECGSVVPTDPSWSMAIQLMALSDREYQRRLL